MVRKLVIFSYPSNVFWFSVVFPLLSLCTKYFSSLLSHGIATELIPSIPHLYQEKYNRIISLFFHFCALISIFFSTLSIRFFITKIPRDKLRGNFDLYTNLITIFGITMNFTFFNLNFFDINHHPFMSILNFSMFYVSASIFHVTVGKIPSRFTYIDDIAKLFNYIIVATSIISVITFNISCLTHRIDIIYYISSIFQYIAILFIFLKYILIGTILNGDQFLSLFVEKGANNQSYQRVSNNEPFLP